MIMTDFLFLIFYGVTVGLLQFLIHICTLYCYVAIPWLMFVSKKKQLKKKKKQ